MFGSVDIDLSGICRQGLDDAKVSLARQQNKRHDQGFSQYAMGRRRGAMGCTSVMQQGHHVTGIHDLVNNEAEDRIRGDLESRKDFIRSGSSGSSLKSGRTLSNPSSGIASRNESSR